MFETSITSPKIYEPSILEQNMFLVQLPLNINFFKKKKNGRRKLKTWKI